MRWEERTRMLMVVGMALQLIACGGDDAGAGDGNTGDGNDQQTPDNGAPAASDADTDATGSPDDATSGAEDAPPAAAGPDALQDGIAGAACTSDADCATGGECLSEVQLAGALAAFTAVGGAPTPAPGGTCSLDCTTDDECGAGGTCVGESESLGGLSPGQCQQACTADADCRDGYRCATGASAVGTDAEREGVTDMAGCVPSEPVAMLDADVVGAPCGSDADCPTGGTCQLEAEGTRFVPGSVYPEGSCSGACLEDADCGAGGRCLLLDDEQALGSCMLECASDSDCRTGYRCREQIAGLSACVPGEPAVEPGQMGIACTAAADGSSAECASRCFDELGGAFSNYGGPAAVPTPGGYCSAKCFDDDDCGGGACLEKISLAAFANLQGSCYATCADDTDCARDGYECRTYQAPAAFFGGDAPMVCQPVAE